MAQEKKIASQCTIQHSINPRPWRPAPAPPPPEALPGPLFKTCYMERKKILFRQVCVVHQFVPSPNFHDSFSFLDKLCPRSFPYENITFNSKLLSCGSAFLSTCVDFRETSSTFALNSFSEKPSLLQPVQSFRQFVENFGDTQHTIRDSPYRVRWIKSGEMLYAQTSVEVCYWPDSKVIANALKQNRKA